MGRRMSGIDLRRDLSAEEAELLIDLLDVYQVITFPEQDQNSFRIAHLERIANHFGAHPPSKELRKLCRVSHSGSTTKATSQGPASQ